MDIKIEIIIGPPTSVLGALGIRGARVAVTSGQKRRKRLRAQLRSDEQIFYFFNIAEARKGLDCVLATEPRAKVKVLRRLRKAGLFWDMEAIRSYCQKLAVAEESAYSFVRCTACAYASLVPHGWIMTGEGKLLHTSIPQLLHQQVTNLKDLLFRFCSEGVWHGEIPLTAALWVICQGAKSGMGTDPKGLLNLLLQPQVQRLHGRLPTDHSICHLPAPST